MGTWLRGLVIGYGTFSFQVTDWNQVKVVSYWKLWYYHPMHVQWPLLKRAICCSPISCSTRTSWSGSSGLRKQRHKALGIENEIPTQTKFQPHTHSKLRRWGRASTAQLTSTPAFWPDRIFFQLLPFCIFYYHVPSLSFNFFLLSRNFFPIFSSFTESLFN